MPVAAEVEGTTETEVECASEPVAAKAEGRRSMRMSLYCEVEGDRG